MPISGATISVICPTCGAAQDVELAAERPTETPHHLLHKTVPYRCPSCGHLGQVKVDLESE
jgi:uncharacterized Zn finger protein